MKRFWKNCKGAVTVFVTFLLIPAVLVSGTAVDLARIYATRSAVQNANQLALNAVLTSYDALLKDIYGLFGVAETDPELADMVDEYINAAVFGEDWQDRGMGTFQLVNGSDIDCAVTSASNKNLKNEDVLRRQIEEYMKFRGPVIIVQRILDKIDAFKTVKKDAEVIEEKIKLDESLDDLFNTYKDIKEKIDEVNAYQTAENIAFSGITSALGDIKGILQEMRAVRSQYTGTFDSGDSDLLGDLYSKYAMLTDNLYARINGGNTYTWVDGGYNGDGDWESGYRLLDTEYRTSLTSPVNPCLNTLIQRYKNALSSYSDALDDLVTMCENADRKKEKFKQDVQNLKNNLDGTSPELKKGLVGEDGTSGALNDAAYKVLEYDTKPMAEAMRDLDKPYIEAAVSEIDNTVYGINLSLERRMSLGNLSSVGSMAGFAVDLEIRNRTISPPLDDTLSYYADLSSAQYGYSAPNDFEIFQSEIFNSTKNKEFYEKLSALISEADGSESKREAENTLGEVLDNAKDLFEEMNHGFRNEPDGAFEYTNSSAIAILTSPSNAAESGFEASDMNNKNNVKNATKNVLGGSILTQIGDLMGEASDKLLLLTYGTAMFSCYTTDSSEAKTMSGIPLGVDVNYYFGSEQEYLFHGNIKDAKANLNSVTTLLFVIRFVFNYISSYSITEINGYVTAIRAIPFVGALLAELVRVGFALAESAIDTGLLRAGRSVPLMKDNTSWRFSISGAIKTINEISSELGGGTGVGEDGFLNYEDYLCIFLLFVKGDDLAARTSNLISLNLTNKKNNIGDKENREARQTAMAAAPLIRMDNFHTDFQITTTAQVNMLFLSMPLAQNGVSGAVPPETIPVTVTDYRGY